MLGVFLNFSSKILTKRGGMFYYIIEIQLDAIIFQCFHIVIFYFFPLRVVRYERVFYWKFFDFSLMNLYLIFIILYIEYKI
jgi:hypothetical protein